MGGVRTMHVLAGAGILLYLLILGAILYALRLEEPAESEITLESVTPVQGVVGKDLEVVLKGSGFDRNTRVSMAIDAGNRSAIIGAFPTWGQVRDLALDGNVLFAVTSPRRLIAIDVSEAERPRMLGSLTLPATPNRLSLGGKTAWVALREEGIIGVDVSDPTRMKLLGTLNLGGYAIDIAVREDEAVVVNRVLGLQTVDIRDSARPRLNATLPLPGRPWAIALKGSFACVGSAKSGLHVVQIEKRGRMRHVASIPLTGALMDVEIQGETAFVVSSEPLLLAVDIRTPDRPRLLGTVPTAGQGRSLFLDSGRVFLLSTPGRLQILDVHDPHKMETLGIVNVPGGVSALSAGRGNVYVGTSRSGVQVLALPTSLRLPKVDRSVVGNTSMKAQGNRIVFAEANGIQIADFHRQKGLLSRGALQTPWQGRPSAFDGRFFFSRGSGPREIINIHDLGSPDHPKLLGKIRANEHVRAIAAYRNILYAVCGKSLLVYSLENPREPRLISEITLSRHCATAKVHKENLYLGYRGGLCVFDIRRPEQPRRIRDLSLPWHMRSHSPIEEMEFSGNLGYAAAGSNGLIVLDMEDRNNPKILAWMDAEEFVYDVAILGENACLISCPSGIHLVDVSTPEKPQITASLQMSAERDTISVVDNTVIIAAREGIHLLPPPVELTKIRLLDSRRMAITLPAPSHPGNYTLRVFRGNRHDELHGAVTFTAVDQNRQAADVQN